MKWYWSLSGPGLAGIPVQCYLLVKYTDTSRASGPGPSALTGIPLVQCYFRVKYTSQVAGFLIQLHRNSTLFKLKRAVRPIFCPPCIILMQSLTHRAHNVVFKSISITRTPALFNAVFGPSSFPPSTRVIAGLTVEEYTRKNWKLYKLTALSFMYLLKLRTKIMQSWKFKKIEKILDCHLTSLGLGGPCQNFFDYLKFSTLHWNIFDSTTNYRTIVPIVTLR